MVEVSYTMDDTSAGKTLSSLHTVTIHGVVLVVRETSYPLFLASWSNRSYRSRTSFFTLCKSWILLRWNGSTSNSIKLSNRKHVKAFVRNLQKLKEYRLPLFAYEITVWDFFWNIRNSKEIIFRYFGYEKK